MKKISSNNLMICLLSFIRSTKYLSCELRLLKREREYCLGIIIIGLFEKLISSIKK